MKVFDCFCFLNEIDLLEVRLHELKDIVDTFVIVEANVTGSGRDKEFILKNHIKNYDSFSIEIVELDLQPHKEKISSDQHLLMYLQREGMKDALLRVNAEDSDIVIFSDLDEIPKAKTLSSVISGAGDGEWVKVLQCRGYYWYCNTPITSPPNHVWFNCPLVSRYGSFKDRDLRSYRDSKDSFPSVADGGWHFSHVGTVEHKQKKMLASSHTEYMADKYTSLDNIKYRSENLIDPYNRGGYSISDKNDYDLPEHIQKNKQKFAHLIK